MKHLMMFLVLIWLQLVVADQTAMAQGSRNASSRASDVNTVASDIDFSSWVGYLRFGDGQSKGFKLYYDGDILFYLDGSIGVGIFASASGGGGEYNDHSYNEPRYTWKSGPESRYRTGTSEYGLRFGYGQISRHGELASGLKDNIYNDFLYGKLSYKAFGRRMAQEPWFASAGIYFEGKMALKKEIPAWAVDKVISYDLFPEIIEGGGDLAVVDINMGDLAFIWGINASLSMYDFKDPKVFYEVGSWLTPSYANVPIGKIYVVYQNGIAGKKGLDWWGIGISVDVSFLFKINQSEGENSSNGGTDTRKRSR